MVDDEFVSLREMADWLGVSVTIAYRMVRTGEVGSRRIGGLYRVSKTDLEKYLQRTHRPARAECAGA